MLSNRNKIPPEKNIFTNPDIEFRLLLDSSHTPSDDGKLGEYSAILLGVRIY